MQVQHRQRTSSVHLLLLQQQELQVCQAGTGRRVCSKPPEVLQELGEVRRSKELKGDPWDGEAAPQIPQAAQAVALPTFKPPSVTVQGHRPPALLLHLLWAQFQGDKDSGNPGIRHNSCPPGTVPAVE